MVVVLAMKGHPGCGKSTIARRVGMALRWPVLDKDDLRDCTLALQLQAACPAPLLNDFSYHALWRVLETQLQLGLSAIIDCPLARPSLFLSLASIALRHSARLLLIECIASDAATWRRRLEARAAQDDVFPSGGGVEVSSACNCDRCEESQQDAEHRPLNAVRLGCCDDYCTSDGENKHSDTRKIDRNSCADLGNDDASRDGDGAICRNCDGYGSNGDHGKQKEQRKGRTQNKHSNAGHYGNCGGAGAICRYDNGHCSKDDGDEQKKQRKGETQNKVSNAGNEGYDDGVEQKVQQKGENQKPADHSGWLGSHITFGRMDMGQKIEQVNIGSEGSFRRGWHKPGSWEELQKLIKGYENCWDYDTSFAKKLVIDTTATANIDTIVLDVLEWIRSITDDSASICYLP